MINKKVPYKKLLLYITILVAVIITANITRNVYNNAVEERINTEIIEAGLDPADYDLDGIAPWNVRKAVTNKEIEKSGLNPDDYTIKGKLTADEIRLEVTRQEINRQLKEYNLSVDDIDLEGIDLLSLSQEEINDLVYEQVYQQVLESRSQ
ncbi:hypothetical protein COB55_02280 [Candidatus Wolfebacteria bacterium]|nr:MAG: hypothetical protein COB55_02280 [Candidatus Wolfebacteria bacterium]